MGYRKLFQVDLEEGNNCIVGGARQPPSANKRNLFFPPGKKKEKKSKSQGDEEKKTPLFLGARQGKASKSMLLCAIGPRIVGPQHGCFACLAGSWRFHAAGATSPRGAPACRCCVLVPAHAH